MRVISPLRSVVASPRRRLIGALAILTVIVGVVTMHSMSGSPTSHAHAVPHGAPAVTTQQATAQQAVPAQAAEPHAASAPVVVQATAADLLPASAVPDPQAPDGHAADQDAGDCCDGCGGHDAAMAMCLMILVAILALVAPARRLLWLAPLELAMSLTSALAVVRALAAPSLHELCISRT